MRVLLILSVFAASAAAADPGSTLAERINALRGEATDCDGAAAAAMAPLSPHPRLSQVPLQASNVIGTLRDAGYAAESVRALTVAGPADVDTAMDALRRHYCTALRSAEFSEIGVNHDGNRWLVVLARPLLADTPDDWREAGKAVLAQVNEARSSARRCGEQSFDATEPLAWNDQLGQAAHAHSRAMAQHDFFDHRGPDGRTATDRVDRTGYRWQRVGENIAAGIGTPRQVVAGWVASPQHCANLMSPDFTEMGAAHAVEHGSRAVIYWTQVLGTSASGS